MLYHGFSYYSLCKLFQFLSFATPLIPQDFDNVDDDYLVTAASSTPPGTHLVGSSSPTNVSSALHIFAGRKIESEIQEATLRKEFVVHSEESFVWRASVMDRLQKWNLLSKSSSDPTQKGYVSRRWLSMIYYYNLVTLYRPTRTIVIGMAGDWSVQACSQALLLFRKFQMGREIAQPWLGVSAPLIYQSGKAS